MWIWKYRNEIDITEWDNYLISSFEPFVEFHSWYLDITCKYWGAFYNTNNNSRIPIPHTKILYLINSVTRPPYVQRLKIIENSISSESEVEALFKVIQNKFSCGVINWDYYFSGSQIRANYLTGKKIDHYNQSQNRNLNKSIKGNLKFKIADNSTELFNWLKNNGESYVYKNDFNNNLFRNLVNKLLIEKKAIVILVKDEYGRIHAAAIFTINASRIVFFLSFNSKLGKRSGAIVGIIHFIQTSIMTENQILDFEGSDIPGVALFYEGFGAKRNSYFELKWNNHYLCKLKLLFKKLLN